MSDSHSMSARRLLQALKRDPKKTALLTALSAILLFMIARSVLRSGGGPGIATAAAPSTSLPVLVNKPVKDDRLAEWLASPAPSVGRNLFAVRFDYFPQAIKKVESEAKDPDPQTFSDDVAKSLAQQADHNRERQVLVENLQRQAAKLRLQTIVMGSRPTAIVEGQLVEEGDVVASFRVLKIEARRMVVEREGIKLEIRMN